MTTPPEELPIDTKDDGVEIAVYVKPRASKSRVLGVKTGRLEVAIAAPPVDGEANEELVRTLAQFFGLGRRSIRIVAGEASRTKRVRLLTANGDVVRGALGALRG